MEAMFFGAKEIWICASRVRGGPWPALHGLFLIRLEFRRDLHEPGPIRGNVAAVPVES
jgi:hypothetical protein